MSYQQVAKLFLRGKINNILKNMTPEQKERIDSVIDIVLNDPNLQHCKREFCNALARTISNEYYDKEVAIQDYRIAIMRAAVAAEIGIYDKPATETLSDPLQRKKWFQTWIFNYLKQILRENKIPAIKEKKKQKVPADEHAINFVSRILGSNPVKSGSMYKVCAKAPLSEETIGIISKNRDMYLKNGVNISFNIPNEVVISEAGTIKLIDNVIDVVSSIKEHSFDLENDNNRDRLEVLTCKGNKMVTVEDELINKLKDRMPEFAKPVLTIYLEDERPNEYISKYGEGSPKIVHIAEYLRISTKEVKRALTLIKLHFTILRLGY